MGKSSQATQAKRSREKAKQERKQEKIAERIQKKELKKNEDESGVSYGMDEDPDLAGIVPGPQPVSDEQY